MRLNLRLTYWLREYGVAAGLAAVCIASLSISAVNSIAKEAQVSPVERLIAVEEIQQLKARYFRCVDQKDWDCWHDVFAPDLEFGAAPGTVRHGPDAMIALMHENGLYDRVKTVHHGHMPEIEILSPTTARGIWAADFRHFYPLGEPYPTTGKEVAAPGKGNHSYGWYYETYVKNGGKWQIKTSRIRIQRTDDEGGITIPQQAPPPAQK